MHGRQETEREMTKRNEEKFRPTNTDRRLVVVVPHLGGESPMRRRSGIVVLTCYLSGTLQSEALQLLECGTHVSRVDNVIV